jgi:nitrogen fixation protein NifU and related proteins
MSDLDELYQEVILDHYRRPRHHGSLPGANRSAEGYNPLCGDRLTIYLKVENGIITGVSFQGTGCAISQASASVMTSALLGKTRAEVGVLFEKFRALVSGQAADGDATQLGELTAMAGVGQFPTRVKCATLAWHSALAALDKDQPVVTTEDHGR